MQEFFIPSDGIKLHAKLEKPRNTEKCPLAIVIHGFTGHMEERHILAVSQAMNGMGVATLRVEMYGHGQSEGRFEDHTLYKWVTGALAVVDYAKTLEFVDSLYLCGHSQGGLLTMLVAGMKRDDFKAIIPLAPAWMIPDGARQGNLVGQSFDPEHIPETIEFGLKAQRQLHPGGPDHPCGGRNPALHRPGAHRAGRRGRSRTSAVCPARGGALRQCQAGNRAG